MSFDKMLSQRTKLTEEIIKNYLPKEEGYQRVVMEAMNYSFLAGGKRLRPLIMEETYRALGGTGDLVKPFMAALEMIHNYSLVHDDLPEMDNDELRRGLPTTHVKYGAAMAVLAGDGLLNYAYETALRAFAETETAEQKEYVIEALQVLAKKSGIYGMVGGQTLDVEAEKKGLQLNLEEVNFVNANKTAALLQAGLMIGAILAGASKTTIEKLEEIGLKIGIAFQLQDDILDKVSTTETLGKPVGSDEKNGKVTYLSIVGMEKTKSKQESLSKGAMEELQCLNDTVFVNKEAGQFLQQLVESLITRKM